MIKRLLMIALASAWMAGCGVHEDRTVFVIVNGRPILAENIRDFVEVSAKTAEFAGRPVPAEDFGKWANGVAAKMFGSILEVELLLGEVEKSGLQTAPEDTAQVLANYNRQANLSAKTLDELALRFGAQEAAFRRVFDKMSRVEAYRRRHWTLDVTELQIDQHYNFLSNQVEKAAQINETAYANAEKAYCRLKNGEKWDVVARECSEDKLVCETFKSYAQEWAAVNHDAMGIRELARVLPAMKTGDFTRPIETDEGLVIFRLIGMNGDLYRLGRILFRMGLVIGFPRDRESARREIAEEYERSERRKTMDRLWEAAKFEYPMGTNFTYKIWKESTEK